MNILYQIAPNLEALGSELVKCIGQTFQMLIISGVIAFVLGLFLGVLLIVTKSDGIMANPVLYKIITIGIYQRNESIAGGGIRGVSGVF